MPENTVAVHENMESVKTWVTTYIDNLSDQIAELTVGMLMMQFAQACEIDCVSLCSRRAGKRFLLVLEYDTTASTRVARFGLGKYR